jgi:hypothetical protein
MLRTSSVNVNECDEKCRKLNLGRAMALEALPTAISPHPGRAKAQHHVRDQRKELAPSRILSLACPTSLEQL